MAILAGKRLVITGVLTDASLAYGVAELATAQGAQVLLTGAGRGLSITQRTAKKLSPAPAVAEFDVTNPAHVESVRQLLSDWFPATTGEIVHVDGGYHAVGA
ncbi:MAG: hypothetical protein EBV66_00445 [Actinobacteria bacterium]|nr:hypothetical protein [Actinomycetota bacterium]